MKRPSVAAPLGVALAGIVGLVMGCTAITSDVSHVVAIEFDTLAYPSVVAGDTLRDSLGRAAPLHAVGLNSAGAVVSRPSFRYIALDSGVSIDTSGYITAQAPNGSVRIVASVNGFQSIAKTLLISRPPGLVVAVGALRDTVFYALVDNPAVNVSPSLSVKIVTRDTAGGIGFTGGWLVSYQAFFHGVVLSQKDTTVATLWDDQTNPTTLDTTDATSGSAARRLRIRPVGLPTAAESLLVVATVKYKGVAIPGSPVRWVIVTRPKVP